MGGGRVTSSTTGVSDVLVSDVLASVEREERNVRLGEYAVIGTSVEGRKTSSSLSGKRRRGDFCARGRKETWEVSSQLEVEVQFNWCKLFNS